MKKYQWMMIAALLVMSGAVMIVESGLFKMTAAVALTIVACGLLVFSLIKLDAFDFPEDSILAVIALYIQKMPASATGEAIKQNAARASADMRGANPAA